MLALGGVMILYARVPDDPAELAATAHTLGAELMPLGPQPELIAAVKTGRPRPTAIRAPGPKSSGAHRLRADRSAESGD